MKGRKQKKSKDTCLQIDRAEPEVYAGGQTYIRITENNFTNADQPSYGLLEQILSPTNMNQAYKRVKSNKGSGGIDKMEVESLRDYLVTNKDELIQSILGGSYRPNPVRRVEIPKENGKIRMLGIPTVIDRVVQQAITQILSPIYERQFSNNSYEFIPKRNAHRSLNKCKDHITDGDKYAVDMDLEKFFDMVILCKSERSAKRTLTNVIPYIEKKLFLKVNRGKMVVAYISKIKFGGYSFYRYGKEGRLRIHPKSITKMKERIKTLTSRSKGWGDARRKEALKQHITGWVNYFKLAEMKSILLQIDDWYRRRLRMVIWK